MTSENLKAQLSSWDGKSKADILAIDDEQSGSDGFEDELISLITDEDCQSASTWLLKHGLEEGKSLDSDQVARLLRQADELVDWPAKLHLLQMMPYFELPSELRYNLMEFCRRSAEDENKFVRAWAYSGQYELANSFAEFRDGLEVVFKSAMESEPASVKARLRDILKKVGKNWR